MFKDRKTVYQNPNADQIISIILKRERIKVIDYTQGGIAISATIETRSVNNETKLYLKYH